MDLKTIQNAVQLWHLMLKNRDMQALKGFLAEDVIFHSPVAFTPYQGNQVVFFILSNVIQIFESFTYHRELYCEDSLSVALEFSANIGDKKLKGIDIIRFNAEGKIIEFEVLLRPKSGLEALSVQMSQRMNAFIIK